MPNERVLELRTIELEPKPPLFSLIKYVLFCNSNFDI